MKEFPSGEVEVGKEGMKVGPFPKKVKIVEVGARDGLQSEPSIVPTEDKICLIDKLSSCGHSSIEVGAFVSSKWIPQMADSAQVFEGIEKKEAVSYPVLTPNIIGYQRAKEVGAKEVAIFASATESFSKRNINRTIAKSLERYTLVTEAAKKDGIKVRGYVSVVLGCPYEGKFASQKRNGCHSLFSQ